LLYVAILSTWSAKSQQFYISGIIIDSISQDPVGSASIIAKNDNSILAYTYTNNQGDYSLMVEMKNTLDSIILEVNSLGFKKQTQKLAFSTKNQLSLDFQLLPQVEELNTVVLKSDEKIKINRDTVSYKVAAFTNKTEQTVEDVLRNIPGIEIDENGNIKAQGKNIQKILIEGDDLADRNYKVISKNLDANVLDKVEVISNYDENPVLKQFLNSEAVVINLKLKDKSKSIWFGTFKAGAGNDKRYLADINLGLIRPEIKFLDLGNYNTTGNPAKGQLENYTFESLGFNDFDENYTFQAEPLLSLQGNSTLLDDKFYTENKSISNNLLANKSIWEKTKLRNSLLIYQDNLNKNYLDNTLYFLPDGNITYSELNQFDFKNTNLTNDLEVKHPINTDNFLTFQTKFSIAEELSGNRLLFNDQNSIAQTLGNKQYKLETNIHHTTKIKKGALTIYGFTGAQNNEFVLDISPNTLLTETQQANTTIKTAILDNTIYQGLKTSLIFKIGKFSYSLLAGITNTKSKIKYDATQTDGQQPTSTAVDSLSGINRLNEFETYAAFKGQYSLIPDKLLLESELQLQHINYQPRIDPQHFLFFNPQVKLRLIKIPVGSFSLGFSRKNEIPKLNHFNSNFVLQNYRSLRLGASTVKAITSNQYSFSYILSKKKERILIDAGIAYSEYNRNLIANSLLTQNLNSTRLVYAPGGSLFTARAGFTTYSDLAKISFKFGYNKTRFKNPFVLNSDFYSIENNSDNYYFRGTTYWKGFLNFRFSGGLNVSRGEIQGSTNTNTTYKGKLESILRLNDRIFGNLENEVHHINNTFYEASTLTLEYRPEKKGYIFGIQAQNLFNTKEYTFSTISDYTRSDLVFEAVPRYVIGYLKFRF
tara:strand:+ start:321 stop:2948 length:2628 start_codon:yes stop_codon:yes gene_type:complete